MKNQVVESVAKEFISKIEELSNVQLGSMMGLLLYRRATTAASEAEGIADVVADVTSLLNKIRK